MSCSSFPALDEIYRELDRIQKQNPDVVTVQTIGRTPEGRDVKAAFAADNAIPADEKETAMVVCGRHGQELGTRLIGTALLEWLVSARGTETLAAQTVIVVPVANPDGCVREEFWAPLRVNCVNPERRYGQIAISSKAQKGSSVLPARSR